MRTYILLLFVVMSPYFAKSQQTVADASDAVINFETLHGNDLLWNAAFYPSWQPYTYSYCNTLYSSDKQFFVAVETNIFPPQYAQMREIDYFHRIQNHFIDIHNYNNSKKIAENDIRKQLHYYDKQFNADTVISYLLPLKNINSPAFAENGIKYAKCEVFALYHNKLGSLFLFCFYTDKAYRKRDDYVAKLAKSIRFRDGAPKKILVVHSSNKSIIVLDSSNIVPVCTKDLEITDKH